MVETGAKARRPPTCRSPPTRREPPREPIASAPGVRAPEFVRRRARARINESSVPALRRDAVHACAADRASADRSGSSRRYAARARQRRTRSLAGRAHRSVGSGTRAAQARRRARNHRQSQFHRRRPARRAGRRQRRHPGRNPRTEEGQDNETPSSLIGRFLANRRRALMVGVSALLVLYGAIQVAGMFGGSDHAAEKPATSSQIQAPEPRKIAAPAAAPAAVAPAPERAASVPAPSRPVSPPPIRWSHRYRARTDRADTRCASRSGPAGGRGSCGVDRLGEVADEHRPAGSRSHRRGSVTGAAHGCGRQAAGRRSADRRCAARLLPATRRPNTRSACAIAEGRGVPANLELAAQWFDRAAKQGLAPAQFRLGGLYEKGLGVKKDLDTARQLYLRPPTRATPRRCTISPCSMPRASTASPTTAPPRNGSARPPIAASPTANTISASSMPAASAWSRTSPNPTNGSRWRPQQGDQDAAKKRDDVAGRLDQQSLVAARLAVADLGRRAAARRGDERQGAARRLGRTPPRRPPSRLRPLAASRRPSSGRGAARMMAGIRLPRGVFHACGQIVAGPFTEPSAALPVSVRDGRRIRLSSPPRLVAHLRAEASS